MANFVIDHIDELLIVGSDDVLDGLLAVEGVDESGRAELRGPRTFAQRRHRFAESLLMMVIPEGTKSYFDIFSQLTHRRQILGKRVWRQKDDEEIRWKGPD